VPIGFSQVASGGPPPHDVGGHWYRRDQLVRMDETFSNAVYAAILAGREHCSVGVVTAPCTKCPKFIAPTTWLQQTGWAA
jgi:hypothetical protein